MAVVQPPTGRPRVGVAMLGAGFIAEYHLAGLAASGGADVRVVVGRSRGKAEALAKRFAIPEASDDVDAALARDDVQAVIVATPDDTHESIANAAARAGKAILLQKPMAGSVAAADRIASTAARHGVDLQVSFMHRFFDEVVEARRWIGEGTIGRVLSARVRNATPGPDWGAWFFRRTNVANGVVDQLGVHGIDLVEHLLGRIRNVSARTRIARPVRELRDGSIVHVDCVDNALASYELDDGTQVAHEMSMTEAAGCDRFRMEIYGEKGTLWLRTGRGLLAAAVPGRSGEQWQVPALPGTAFGKRQHEVWLAGVAGHAPRLHTAGDALRGMRVVEALMRSADAEGRAVPVAADDRAAGLEVVSSPGDRS